MPSCTVFALLTLAIAECLQIELQVSVGFSIQVVDGTTSDGSWGLWWWYVNPRLGQPRWTFSLPQLTASTNKPQCLTHLITFPHLNTIRDDEDTLPTIYLTMANYRHQYEPSLLAALIFVVLFVGSAIHQVYQIIMARSWFFIFFIIGCICKCDRSRTYKVISLTNSRARSKVPVMSDEPPAPKKKEEKGKRSPN